MTKTYRIGALWIGGELSYLEQLCLKSFVDAGQDITLYTYGTITNAPAGVALCDAATVLPETGFLRHARTGSPALHSDLFRYHLLAQNDDVIWADTDAYCLRPFTTTIGHFYAWESDHGLNGGVLGLPRDSDTLGALLEFTVDEFAIPPWFSPDEQDRLRAMRDAGTPVHAAEQPWGVWGPAALTHFLKATGEVRYALPREALYPFHYRDRREMLRPGVKIEDYVTEESFSIHFYGRRMRARIRASEPSGVPRPRSVIGRLLKLHGIDPRLAPLKAPAGGLPEPVPAAGWQQGLPDLPQPPQRVTDVTGRAVAALWNLWQRFGCTLTLLPAGNGHPFEDPAAALASRAELLALGVPPDRVSLATSPAALQPADLVLNLDGFGSRWNRRLPAEILAALSHSDTMTLSDIRKGSGAWGWLKAFGPTSALNESGAVTRVLTRPAPPPEDSGWSGIARELAGPQGFFEDLGAHSFLYVPRSQEVLVVTFDNLDIAMTRREDRRPWGFNFIEKQGWSMLGVMAGGWTWYRDPAVLATFRRLQDEGFFRRFGRVVFYGASMGGYAAAAFSGVAPGADVVAFSPQTTLDRAVVPWETRYKTAWHRDFSGPFGDAALVSGAAGRVVLIYDPDEGLDARHIARFQGENVVRLPAPLMGHRLGSSLAQMGILSEIVLRALEGSLTARKFHQLLRARRSFPRYQRELFEKAVARGHLRLARRMAERVLQTTDNRALREGLRKLRKRGDPGAAGE